MQLASRPERLAPRRRDEQIAGTFRIRRARPADCASAPAVSLWRLPRARSLLALVFLATFAALVAGVARVYTDLLWFRELGHEPVLWTTLKWKILAHGLPAFGTASFVLLNLAVVERVVATHAPIRPYRRLAYPLAAVAAGLISSEWRTHAAWHLLALWSGRGDFGARDPLFHRDVGFFVFSLPLYQQAARWALDAVVMGGVGTAAAYAAAGALRHARAHLLTLAALALVVLAWRYRLEQFALALPHEGSIVPGASYSDVHVRLPASRVLAFGCLGGAPLCLYAARRRVPRAATVAVATLAVVAVAAGQVLPPLIQGVYVEPQQLSREKPYVADAIASTRRAFALTDMSVRAIPARSRPFAREIAANRRTIANVPLWDASVLRPMLNDQASIGRYYSFPRTTVDRYAVDGVPRLVALAARQLDRRRLAPDARSWANDRFAYTHGYGIVAVSGGAVDGGGHPRFIARDFESARGALGLREPRTYFAEQRDRDPPYVIVPSRRGEIDQPIAGSRAPDYHYDGDGGIALSSPLRRLAFAARFGDLKLLLTETVTDRSRIILHRNASGRRAVRGRPLTIAAALLAAAVAAAPADARAGGIRVEVAATGLEIPWDIAFLPHGRALVTERPGRVRLLARTGRLRRRPVARVPVSALGEGGLLGLAIDPAFAANRFVYLYFTTATGMRLERRRWTGSRLTLDASLVDGIRAGAVHDSGRIAFGPDRRLYVSTGDAGEPALAQDRGSLNGKLLALSTGQYRGRGHAAPEVVAGGLRNSQGFDWQPGTGRLIANDHGPSGFDGPEGFDEIDEIVPGGNYGWPEAIAMDTGGGRFRAPLRVYRDAIAPSGATFVSRGRSRWTGDYILAALSGEQLRRIVLRDGRVVRDRPLLRGRYGRLRTVVEGPRGCLYVLTSNRDGRGEPTRDDDRILRVRPPGAQRCHITR